MKPIRRSGPMLALMALMLSLALSLPVHATIWPYGPAPSAPRGAQVMWVCKVEPLVPMPTAPRTWDMRYESVSPLQGIGRPYGSPFRQAGLLPAVSQPQPVSYPLVRRCRPRVVISGLPR